MPGNPGLALGSGLALHPARSSDAGVTLIRWVSICYGGGRESEGGVPPASAEALCSAFRQSSQAHRSQLGSGTKVRFQVEEKVAVFPRFGAFASPVPRWNALLFVLQLSEEREKAVYVFLR